MQLHDTTLANMNFFGFTPAFFDVLEREFDIFLEHHLHDPKFEYYLPHALDRAIADDGAKVRVIPTSEDWFGVTNVQDKKTVQEAIKRKILEGEYPERLWG